MEVVMFSCRWVEISQGLIKSILDDPFVKVNVHCVELSKNLQQVHANLTFCRGESTIDSVREYKIKVLRALNVVEFQINTTDLQLSQQKIVALQNKLLKIQTQINASDISVEKYHLQLPKIDMHLALIWDVDVKDHNGTFLTRLENAINSKMPIVTTRSELCAIHFDDANSQKGILRLEKLLLKQAHEWSIYQQQVLNGEGFIVMIPKGTANEEESLALLTAYDFNSHAFKKISVCQALTVPGQSVEFDTFTQLFVETPQKNKLIQIAGHGGAANTAGLSKAHFQRLIQFFAQHRCQGMIVHSCRAGGLASLRPIELIQAAHRRQVEVDIGFDVELPCLIKFPIVVHSLGDFSTYSGQEAEKDFSAYFAELSTCWSTPGGATIENTRKAFSRAEKGLAKHPANSAQVYFPAAFDSPVGFRPVGEDGRSFSLTHLKVQSTNAFPNANGAMVVQNKKFLQIHPLVVDCSLVFQEVNAYLLSMIPGPASHYLKNITLAKGDAQQYFKENLLLQKYLKGEVEKTFYIENLQDADSKYWQHIVFHLDGEQMYCLYYQDGNPYCWSGKDEPQPISELQYAMSLEKLLTNTDPLAVHTQTAGQQDDKTLQNAINQHSKIATLRQKFKLESLKILDKQEWNALLEEITTIEDKTCLIFQLLRAGRADLIQAMLVEQKLPIDLTDMHGMPLIVASVYHNAKELALFLLNQNYNPKSCDPGNGNTLLHIAAKNGDIGLLSALLDKQANIEAQNNLGTTPIFATVLDDDKKMFNLLKSKGANLNASIKSGHSLINIIGMLSNSHQMALFLNEMDIDLNTGERLPLVTAIHHQDLAKIDLLLDKGASLYHQDRHSNAPIIQAMLCCPSQIVLSLFNREDFSPNFEDHQGISPLLAALRLGHKDYVNALLAKGAVLPQKLSRQAYNFIECGLKRLKNSGDFSLIPFLLSAKDDLHLDLMILRMFYAESPELIAECCEAGFFKRPQFIFEELLALLYYAGKKDDVKYASLRQAFIKSGIDLKQRNSRTTCFEKIICYGGIELVKWALAKFKADYKNDQDLISAVLNSYTQPRDSEVIELLKAEGLYK